MGIIIFWGGGVGEGEGCGAVGILKPAGVEVGVEEKGGKVG